MRAFGLAAALTVGVVASAAHLPRAAGHETVWEHPPADAQTWTVPTVPTTMQVTYPDGVWDRVAACESNTRWDDTRAGFEGGLHFLYDSWVSAGGRIFTEHAYQATRAQQITVARAWLRRTSVGQWPVCGPLAGLTMADAA